MPAEPIVELELAYPEVIPVREGKLIAESRESHETAHPRHTPHAALRTHRRRPEEDRRREDPRARGQRRPAGAMSRILRGAPEWKLHPGLSALAGALLLCVTLGLGMVFFGSWGGALGGLCIGLPIGGAGGALIRSARGWLFVLAWAGLFGLISLAWGDYSFLFGIGVGALVGWVLAAPIKVILLLVRA
jgi:hypothetical protein